MMKMFKEVVRSTFLFICNIIFSFLISNMGINISHKTEMLKIKLLFIAS